jgi:hypothetical protein
VGLFDWLGFGARNERAEEHRGSARAGAVLVSGELPRLAEIAGWNIPALSLRNPLTVPVLRDDARAVWIEAGDRPKYVNERISPLALNSQTIG